jgi:hypothetical protein
MRNPGVQLCLGSVRDSALGKPAPLGSSPRAGFFRDHALLKIRRLTALRCAPVRRRLRIAEPAAERPREEVAAIVLITGLIVATLVIAWGHRGAPFASQEGNAG